MNVLVIANLVKTDNVQIAPVKVVLVLSAIVNELWMKLLE